MNLNRKHRPTLGLCSQAIALTHFSFALPGLQSFRPQDLLTSTFLALHLFKSKKSKPLTTPK
jgi:hypothetical protein